MKKIYSLLFVVLSSVTYSQTTLTQWNFDDAAPATAMLPTTGTGTFTIIGGVTDNLTSGLMPGGNPSTGKAYSVKNFPASLTASGTAGFQFAVSTAGITDQINVSFDPRGSGTSSRWQQYEFTINGGTTWTVLSNNGGLLTNTFTATPMVTLTFPASCSNNANFGFKIVSIFDPAGTDYASVTGGTTAYGTTGGTWRIDNATFSYGVLKLNQNTISNLKVFVNNKNLYVNSDSSETKSVSVYDILGKQVVNAEITNESINVSNLSAGIYIVKVIENEKTATKKLVIE